MCATASESDTPKVVERFLKALIVANKAVGLYPPSSTIPRDTSEAAAASLREAFQEFPELTLGVERDGITFEGTLVLSGKTAYSNFARELYNRQLADVTFHVGAGWKDILSFLTVLGSSFEEIQAAGGFESRLWERSVTAITVNEVHVTIVDEPSGTIPHTVAFTHARTDEALGITDRTRKRDKMYIERFLADPQAIAEYLQDLYSESGSEGLVAARFALLASLQSDEGEYALNIPRSLADALSCIDMTLRSDLLINDLLPEAVSNEQVADVLRQMDVTELLRMVVAGSDPENPQVEALARAVRHVGAITAGNPGDIEVTAGVVMREAGMSEDAVTGVLEAARPRKVTISPQKPRAKKGQQAATHSVVALTEEELHAIPEIEEFKAEAKRGVSAGDVALAMTVVVAAADNPERFAPAMAALEAALNVVVDRGEISAAGDAAEALEAIAGDPRLAPEQKTRVEDAIARLAKPEDVRLIAQAMRTSAPGTPERAAADRLLELLGPRAVKPLVEQLAAEQDMAARKSLIDLLSGLAPRYIGEVGSHITDSRWYVVRNVVVILGSTKSSAVIPFLESALRHPESRVRREAIRALSGINDRLSHQMLISALSDEDPQNVQIAARYLGAAKVTLAAPALERVARGEGHGGRELGPRVEAIESLGRMGAVGALPTLEALTRRRTLIGGTKTRELRAAAKAAVKLIKSRGGQG